MKNLRRLFLVVLNIVCLLIISSCHHPNEKTRNLHDHSKKQYTCSMHPEVIEDEPGDCRKCNMALIEKTRDVIKIESDSTDNKLD